MNPPNLADYKDLNVFCVYMLQCADRTLYVGMTNDIANRIRQHNREIKGGPAATAPACKHPVKLVYFQECASRSAALGIEHMIKSKSRDQRVATIKQSVFGIPSNFDPGPLIRKSASANC